MRYIHAAAVCLCLSSFGWGADAFAETSPYEGKLRLGLGLSLVDVAFGTASFESAFNDGSADYSTVSVGPEGVFFDFGYGVDRSIILGSRLRVSWARLSIEGASGDLTNFALTPYIEVPMSQDPLTGFFVGSVGFFGQFSDGFDRFGANFAAGLGIRGFLGDGFSMEGSVQAKFDIGTLQTERSDALLIAPGLLVLVGFSGWL